MNIELYRYMQKVCCFVHVNTFIHSDLFQDIVNLQAQTERESIQRGKIYQRPEHLLKPYEKAINAASEELGTYESIIDI